MTDAPKDKDRARLQRQVVVFLDLLGFRARMIEASKDAILAANLLVEYDAAMGDALQYLDRDSHLFRYKGFTDNFVICTPLADGFHPEERFGVLVSAVANFQLSLSKAGWFVRGGIALGEFYLDNRIVFGPALIEAYELEQRVAIAPRIVLSEECKNLMRSFVEFYANKPDAPQNLDVLVDVDGRAFINYLAGNYTFGPELEQQVLHDLEIHKTNVERLLNASRADPSVWDKYRWVAKYHDFFVREIFPRTPGPLGISETALAPQPTRLSDAQLPAGYPIPWER